MIVIILFQAEALEHVIIYSDLTNVRPGASVTIPVKIDNNPGIMGFRVSVHYDSSVLKPLSARKGDVLDSGLLSDGVSIEESDQFDVIWTGTQDIKKDGILFYLNFAVLNNASPGKTVLHFTYSQPDTFNELWEDVQFEFQEITVIVRNDSHSTMEISQNGSSEFSAQDSSIIKQFKNVDDVVVKQTIDIELNKLEVDSIANILPEQQTDFLNNVTKSLTDKGVVIDQAFMNQTTSEKMQGISSLYTAVEAKLKESSVFSVSESENDYSVIRKGTEIEVEDGTAVTEAGMDLNENPAKSHRSVIIFWVCAIGAVVVLAAALCRSKRRRKDGTVDV